MNNISKKVIAIIVLTMTLSVAIADGYHEEEYHPGGVFINVIITNPGVGPHGLAEFKVSHIPDEGQSAMFVDGKIYFADHKANDNMLALAVWSYTHNQKLRVQLDPNATGKHARIYQMYLAGPID